MKKDYEDDGRTIADMSEMRHPSLLGRLPKSGGDKKAAPPDDGENSAGPSVEVPKMTKKESRLLMLYSLGAALLIAGIFIAVFAVFILFCVKVWFA